MGGCVGKKKDPEPTLSDRLQDTLPLINECYPGTDFVCVINRQGDVLASANIGYLDPLVEDVGSAVAALRRAAVQFSKMLGQGLCPVVHIAGDVQLFSCYDLGQHVIAFYSMLPGKETPDTHGADVRLGKVFADLCPALGGQDEQRVRPEPKHMTSSI